MHRLRFAVVGLGEAGRAHADRLRDHDDCLLAAVCDSAPGAIERAAVYGVPRFHRLADLLDAMRPDGIILATPAAWQVEGALQCLVAGVPVLIEPPLADAPDMVSGLIRCVEASGVPVLVGHRRRYSPIIEEARRVIRDGRLGRLVTVMGSAAFARPASDFHAAPWRRQKDGGPILSDLVDEIDTLRVLAGEIVDVQALASHAVRGFEVEDTAAISLRFAGGALGTFMLSDCAAGPFNWTQTSGESVVHAQTAGANCYYLSGTRGTLSVPSLRLLTHPGAPSWRSPLVEATLMRAEADPWRRQLDHFCRVVRRTAVPLCTVQDAARTLAGVLAVARAAETGERVALA